MNYYIFDYKSGRIEIVTKRDLKDIILQYKDLSLYLKQTNRAIFIYKSKAIEYQDIWYKRKAYHQNKI